MRALGIDFGGRRIGLALSDPTGTLARPWRTLERREHDDDAAAHEVASVASTLMAEEDGLVAVVVGLPAHLDGTPSDESARVQAFASRLEALLAVPVVLQDERLTSHEAESRLALRERDWRRRKARLDAAAAAVILQDYLDSRRPPGPSSPDEV